MNERYAILGDIHSNLDAFEATLDDAKSQNVTRYLCVGDVIGYNADPVPCLDRIIEMQCTTVLGNHDHYCSSETELDDFHPLAAEVIEWTRKQLSQNHISFLQDLSLVKRVSGFTLVHSTLDMPEKWGYVFDEFEAAANFSYQSTPLCFHGHTHVPVVFERQKRVTRSRFTRLDVTAGSHYFINVGSVGQPRDGDPRAAYCIYDTESRSVELRRITYDVTKAQEKILKAGLPERLAKRLQFGK
jgi:diadenosine tetraphosphatase ApaH/serine/threonine PP2A family protein phosphatase